jgi:hypothetical protein
MTIEDLSFLKTLFRRFVGRGVSTKSDIEALMRLSVTVREMPDGSLTISVCDHVGSVLDIGWWSGPGVLAQAWGRRMLVINDGLLRADQRQLTRFVWRFLMKHGVIDNAGTFTKRGAA